MNIKRFVDDLESVHSDFTLKLSAGYIDTQGVICREQFGAKDTFSVGMPVYGEDDKMIGRLSIGLWENLNYATKTKDGLDIPAECWRVDGYTGKRQDIKTYWQVKDKDITNAE